MIRSSRTLLSFVAILSLSVAAAACGGGGGGSKPTISAFSASPAAIPFGGGQVTFHWSVAGASSLDLQPGVGAVTGTSATVAITTSGQWTLTATNSHGSVSAQTAVVVGAAMTVQGRVQAFGPVANVSVLVLNQPGASVALTNTAGAFTITNVVAPYDLAIVSPLNHQATIYRGLTRPDPTLTAEPNPGALQTANLSGTLALGSGFPEGATTTSRLSMHNKGGFTNISRNPSTSDSSWSNTSYPWIGPTTIDVVFHALEWTFDVNNHPVSFTRFGSATKTGVTNGSTFTGIDIPLAPVPSTGTLSGTIAAPAGYSTTLSAQLSVAFAPGFTGGPSIDAGDSLVIDGLSTTNGGFSFHTPVLSGVTFVVSTGAFDADGFTQTNRSGLSANSTGVNIVVPLHPTLLLPPPDGLVGTGTLFAWTAPDQAISRVTISSGGYSVSFLQEGTQLAMPDLSVLGLPIVPGGTFQWSVTTFGSFASIDDAAGPGGLRAPSSPDEFAGSCQFRQFTGAPN